MKVMMYICKKNNTEIIELLLNKNIITSTLYT